MTGRQEWIGRSGGPSKAVRRRVPAVLGVKPRERPGYFASPNPTGHPSQAADEGLRMSALNRVPSLLGRAGTASALTIAAVGGSIVAPGIASDAAAATPATKALQVAASKKGAPYQYGAAG